MSTLSERDSRKAELKLKVQKAEDELRCIAAEEEKEELARRTEHSVWCMHNLSEILTLIPDHKPVRWSALCSDDDPCNEEVCARCFVLHAKKFGYWDSNYFLDVAIRKY